MRMIKLAITETVTYQRWYEVDDDFDATDDSSLEELVCEDDRHGSNSGFEAVEDMSVEEIPQ